MPILDPDFKPYWLSALPGIIGVEVFSLMLYMAFMYRHDFMMCMQALCMSGVALPVTLFFSHFFRINNST